MSPLGLRRYRAERLLREQFEAQRNQVLRSVRARLGRSGINVDDGDLDACYAQAWQGLYSTVLAGREIANPAGWLVLVTFRRAIDEQRAHRARRCEPLADEAAGADAAGTDLAAELDDRTRLRHLFEGLHARLTPREREAATLCYLQGHTRAEAAARMGLSEARMSRLMEGRGAARPGVAAKVGALVELVREGTWCEEQGSLMRGFAYGLLDPQGERYHLACKHTGECPACRAHVASLRGLAAVLPPVFLPGGLAAAALASLADGTRLATPAAAGSGASAGVPGIAGGGAVGGSGAGGAAAGGWVLAGGGAGAKLALGCLLAVGLGAGCAALAHGPPRHPERASIPAPGRLRAALAPSPVAAGSAGLARALRATVAAGGEGLSAARPAAVTAAAQAGREFGPEQQLAAGQPTPAPSDSGAGAGRARTATSTSPARNPSMSVELAAPAGSRASAAGGGVAGVPARAAGGAGAAAREFSPG